MSIEMFPLFDGTGRCNPLVMNQEGFIRHSNKCGIIMAGMPHYYLLGKSGSKADIRSVQMDFDEEIIISATRLFYSEGSLDSRIVHGYGSKLAAPVEKKLVIPHFDRVSLDDVLDMEEGVVYIQALFDTDDNPKEIKKVMQRLSSRRSNEIKIHTSDQEGRAADSIRVATLFYNNDGFYVSGCHSLDEDGRSREINDDICKAYQTLLKNPIEAAKRMTPEIAERLCELVQFYREDGE